MSDFIRICLTDLDDSLFSVALDYDYKVYPSGLAINLNINSVEYASLLLIFKPLVNSIFLVVKPFWRK